MNKQKKCPVCMLDVENIESIADRWFIDCPACGPYSVAGTVLAILNGKQLEKSTKVKVTAWIREHKVNGNDPPFIHGGSIKLIEENSGTPNFSTKMFMLMKLVVEKTFGAGEWTTFVPKTDYPLVRSPDETEFRFILKALQDRGLLEYRTEAPDAIRAMVTASGWDYFDKHAQHPPASDLGFVAMSFDPQMTELWQDGIRPAVERAGYVPIRVDKEHHIERIDAYIMRRIQESKFVIADVTQQRHGVYFEAGYAIGLGRPVIWTVRKDEMTKVHFDTRQFNHLTWTDPPELIDELSDRICVVIGKGPLGTRTLVPE